MSLINVTSSGCELAELLPYPETKSTTGTVFVDPITGPDGKITNNLELPRTDGTPRATQTKYGGNWLWGGWTPIYTDDQAQVDDGWDTAFTVVAPDVDPKFGTHTLDLEINGNMGQQLNYCREAILRCWYGWQVLVDGVVVGSRSTANVFYDDTRTNLGDETINGYYYQPIGDFHWVRNNVPPGATVEVQFRRRHQVVGAQTNAYVRVIGGVYRECNFRFSDRRAVLAT